MGEINCEWFLKGENTYQVLSIKCIKSLLLERKILGTVITRELTLIHRPEQEQSISLEIL